MAGGVINIFFSFSYTWTMPDIVKLPKIQPGITRFWVILEGKNHTDSIINEN